MEFEYARPLTIAQSGCTTMFDIEVGNDFHRHSDLWFEDGSVICRAEKTLFRVHMSQLGRHSECFKDMFRVPQPQSTRSEAKGSGDGTNMDVTQLYLEAQKIPVVQLHDAEEDVGNLLSALYDGPNFGNNSIADFRAVSGVLRLSTKYLIDSLRDKALAHLTTAWPSTLKGWDAREDTARQYEIQGHLIGARIYPHPIDVINLSRDVDAPELLPAAFYDLSRYAYIQIFEPSEDDPLFRPPSLLPRLSYADLQRLTVGKEAAQHTITSLIQAMESGQHIRQSQQLLARSGITRRHSGSAICMTAAACRKDFSELVDLATQHYLFDRERGYCDPLYVADELGQLKSSEFSECKACAKALEMWAVRERETMWRMISSWFRLEVLPCTWSGDVSPIP